MPDFLPRRDAALLAWSRNFQKQISDDPGVFGLTPGDAAAFSAVQQAYAHWFTKANQPSTRGPMNVMMKDASRAAMMKSARELAGMVRARAATTPEQLSALGLRAVKSRRRRVPRPLEKPTVRLGNPTTASVKVRLVLAGTGRCAKPAGVTGAVLMFAVGEQAPTDESGWRLWRVTGDPTCALGYPVALEPGQKLWVTACWLNNRGEPGPWATPTGRVVGYTMQGPGMMRPGVMGLAA